MIKKIIYGVASLILIVVGLLAYLTKNDENVVTTLNFELQKAAYDALGSYDGGVIAMEASTGKILAMETVSVLALPLLRRRRHFDLSCARFGRKPVTRLSL